jgi:uncharacterized protein
VRLFLDSSALAKRYVAEKNSAKTRVLCHRANRLAVSIICLPELISMLRRLVRERRLSEANYQDLRARMFSDVADADICEITTDVMKCTISLLEAQPLRAMGAIQVACAHVYEAELFASADHRQLAAARKLELKTVDLS